MSESICLVCWGYDLDDVGDFDLCELHEGIYWDKVEYNEYLDMCESKIEE